jgi:FYVE/RhoGEF/PH domain-containing protein 5/6
VYPISRIPRYMLLLGEVMRHTPSDHPDYENLYIALQELKSIVDHVNMWKQQLDDARRVCDQIAGVDHSDLCVIKRSLLANGVIGVDDNQCFVAFFNDALLIAERRSSLSFGAQQWKCKEVFKFGNDLHVTALAGGQFKASSASFPGQSITFTAADVSARQPWLDALKAFLVGSSKAASAN